MGHADDKRKTGSARTAPTALKASRLFAFPVVAQREPDQAVSDIMRRPAPTIAAGEAITTAARRMRDDDIGCLLVTHDDQLVGILTDRDLVVRVLAGAADVSRARVEDCMTCDVVICRTSHSVAEAAAIMGDNQVRRLPVRDAFGCLVGVLGLDQIAENFSEQLAGETLGEVVERR